MWRGISLLIAALLSTVFIKPLVAETATTQPVMTGRDTPAGAMNVFEQAIVNGDFATAADSYNLPGASRFVRAAKQISGVRLYRAVEKRFGRLAAGEVRQDANITVLNTSRQYSDADWTNAKSDPKLMYGLSSPIDGAATSDMQQGSDGIWRIGRITAADSQPPGLATAMKARAIEMLHLDDPLIRDIENGKYATADDFFRSIEPQRPVPVVPPAFQRQMDEQRQKELKEEAARQAEFLAAKFDLTTFEGARDSYVQAIEKKDAEALAGCFFAEGDSDGKFAWANGHRILSALQLSDTIATYVGRNDPDNLVKEFGLLPDLLDFPYLRNIQQNGNKAVYKSTFGPITQTISFQKVDGQWKQNITPTTAPSVVERTSEMEEDNASVVRITADIVRGKYLTVIQIRDGVRRGDVKLRNPIPCSLLTT